MTSQMDPHLVAHRLRAARQRIFKSASQAAASLGMNASTVRAHENGQNGVGLVDLERYARRYGASLDWLLAGKGQMEVSDTAPSIAHDEIYPVMVTLQDGSWVEDDEDSDYWPGWGWIMTPGGALEEVHYTDPRFPYHILTAAKVKSAREDGPYPDGTIVFAVDSTYTGYREGDHVVVMREKGAFYEWSLRRVVSQKGETWFEALTSDAPPFKHQRDRGAHDYFSIVIGVVVGAVTRRPVPALSVESRIHFEREYAARRGSKIDIPVARRPVSDD